MKQKDIALIIVIVAVSGVASFFIARTLLMHASSRKMTAEDVQAISKEFDQPDSRYFNSQSIDPTQLIQIGTSVNASPYASQQ